MVIGPSMYGRGLDVIIALVSPTVLAMIASYGKEPLDSE
jgi:hypothetical protein